ncbi:hypothetical protein DIPPA_11029, partial [Diplonema papillatum]
MIICQICHLKPRPGFGLRVVRSTKNIMSFERTDAVALVKKVTGVDVPSAFFFERKNPAAQQVVDWAERATGLKEQALRALLEAGGFTGDNAALWRLAWVHRASSPNTSEQVVGAFLAGRFPEETARQTAAHRARGVQGAEAVGRRGRGTPLGTPRGSEAGAAAEDAVPEPARRPDGADDGAGKRGQSQDAEVVGEAAVRIHLLEKQMEALQAQGKQQTALLSRLVDKIDEKNERQAVAADPRESRALCDSDDDSEGTDKASSERTGTPFGFLPRGMASLDPEKWSLRASKRSYSTELNHCKEELSKFQVRTEPKKRQTHHKDLQSLQNELVKIKAELLREKTKTEKLQAVLRSRQQVTSSDAQSLNLEKRQRDLEVKERVYKGNENRLLDDRQELEKAQRQLDKQMKEYHEQHSELLKQRQLLSKDAAQLASLQRQVAAAEEELRAREQQVAEAEKQMERDCTRQTGELKRMQRERERLEAQQGMQKERERAVIERERVADKMSFGLLYAQDTDGAKADCVFGPAYQARSESKGVPAAERTGHEEFHSLPGGFKGCKGNGHMAPTPMPSAPNSISSSPTVAAVVPVGLMSPGLCHGQSNRRSKTACHTNNRVPVSDPEACPAPLSTPPRDSLTGGNSHVYNIPSPSKPAQHHKTRRRVSASSGTSNTRHSQPKLYNSLSAPRNSGATLFSSASHNSVIAVNSLNQSVHSATHTAAHAKFPGTLEELELRKQNAIKNEDFALAKRIKDQIQSLTDFQASLTQLRCKQEPDGAP